MTGADSVTHTPNAALPRCSIVDIYKPCWPQWAWVGLTFIVCVALTAGLLVFWNRPSPTQAVITFAVRALILGIPVAAWLLALYLADRVRARNIRRHFRRLESAEATSPSPAPTPDEAIARDLRNLSLRQRRNIPTQYTAETKHKLPDAIILRANDFLAARGLRSTSALGWPGRPIPTPASNSTPFEPLPLGRDPQRTRALLEEFVGQRFTVDHPVLARLTGRHPSILQIIFSIPRALLAAASIVLLWALVARDVVAVGHLVYTIVGVIGVSCVFNLGWWLASRYRENSMPSCWLFPGAIAVRIGRSTLPHRRRDVVARRGSGTLWYDARAARLFVPLPNGAHHVIRCPLHDGVLAIWAWLNTAQAPDAIHLDDIA